MQFEGLEKWPARTRKSGENNKSESKKPQGGNAGGQTTNAVEDRQKGKGETRHKKTVKKNCGKINKEEEGSPQMTASRANWTKDGTGEKMKKIKKKKNERNSVGRPRIKRRMAEESKKRPRNGVETQLLRRPRGRFVP